MKLPLTLSKYIARQFLVSFGIVFCVLALLIIILDTVELLRRSYSVDVSAWIMVQMAILKFPIMGQKIAPFAILVGAVLAFTKLTRTHELIVARSAGVSVWQFVMPAVIVAFFLGIMMITIINPVAGAMVSKYQQIENKYFKGQISSLAVSASGLWLRQKNDSLNTNFDKGESIIHALRAGKEEGVLYDVIIFVYENKDIFAQRIDAQKAKLENDFWHLHDVVITTPNKKTKQVDEYFLETELTLDEIQSSLAPPETLSFWELPKFIQTLKEAGFSAEKHRLHLHSILVSPFFYVSMIFIAILFSLSPPRQAKSALLISGSILAGFLIYFLTDLVSALGLAGNIPIILAAWAPVGITALTGVTLLLHFEDG